MVSGNIDHSYPSVIDVSAIKAAVWQTKERIAYAVDDFNLKLDHCMLAGD